MKLFHKKKENRESQPKIEPEKQWEKGILTLYACRKRVDVIPEVTRQMFEDVMSEFTVMDENHFTITLQDTTIMDFSITAHSDENYAQAKGMANYFSQAPLVNQQVKEAALIQMQLFNCIIGIQFLVDDNEERTKRLINSIYEIAQELTAFILHPTMALYRPDGKLVISIDGKSDLEEFYPQANSSLLDKDIEESPADIERKNRSIAICREKEIPYIEHLRAAVYEAECQIPKKEDIIRRLACVFAAAVRSEELVHDQAENREEKARKMMERLNEGYQIFSFLSAEERDYLNGMRDDMKSHNRFGWRYECCAVLLWAVSLLELGDPDHICDVTQLGAMLWNNDFDSIMEQSNLRSKKELMDMQDLIFRYDWACVDMRIHNKEFSVVKGDIVFEWHYALNWLVGADGISDWDMVKTTT